MNTVIACEVGGSFVRFGLVRDDRVTVQRTEALAGSDQLGLYRLDLVEQALMRFVSQQPIGANEPLALAMPGPVHDGVLLSAPTLVGDIAVGASWQEGLAGRLGRRVTVMNDLSATAGGFAASGAAQRAIVVTVGSGVGSKAFDRAREPWVFAQVGFAGEIGHLPAGSAFRTVPCECGGVGHIGAVASGRGTQRMARASALAHPAPFQRSAVVRAFGCPDALSLTNEEHLVPAARAHDSWALGEIRRAAKPLAHALAFSAVAFGVIDVFVVGGFATALGSTYEAVLEEQVNGVLTAGPPGAEVALSIKVRGDAESMTLRGAAAGARDAD